MLSSRPFRTPPRRALAALGGSLLLALAAPLGAQQPTVAMQGAPTRPAIDARVRREVIDSIAAHLERLYADADTGRLIAEHVRRRERGGAYASLTDPMLFAETLTDDLRAINGDKHLSVDYAPNAQAMPAPGRGGLPTPYLGAPGGGGTPPPQMVQQARRNNFGFARVEILPGNVGYLDIRGFSGLPEAEDAALAALEFLERADAVILDVRRAPGGSPRTVNFLISHFTGPDTIPSIAVHNRSANQRATRYTLATVPGKRRPDVPVYVLTSPGTASAAEDLAFVLRNLGRATLVGERTAGAGRNNAFIASGHGFVTSISYTRVTDPRTGAEWEGVGVQPTIAVPEHEALAVAHAHAVRAIAERETAPPRQRLLALIAEAVDAQRTARQVEPATLARYAGSYGRRVVSVRDGRLWLHSQAGRPGDEMVPLSDSTFAINHAMRASFEPGAGGVPRLRLSYGNGESLVLERSTAAASSGSRTSRE